MVVASSNVDLKRPRRSSSNGSQSPKKARIGDLVEGHSCVGDQMKKSELETATTAQISCKMSPALQTTAEAPANVCGITGTTSKDGGETCHMIPQKAPAVDILCKMSPCAPQSPALQTTAEAAPNVCVVTGTMSKDVETCHIIPKDALAVDIEQLEEIWGLERHSLDVDHASNLIFLTRELSRAFKSGEWALVPSGIDLVWSLKRFEVGRNGASNIFDVYDKTEQPMFAYDIVPLPGCKVTFGPAEDPSPSLRPPYTTLPKVTLPIYPHLVLVNLTAKYARLSSKVQESIGRWMSKNNSVAGCLVHQCFGIHKRWLPTRKFEHEYAHLPPVDKALNRLLGPEDSYSQVLKRMGVFEDEDEEEEEEVKDRTRNLHATRTKRQLRKMVEGWLTDVRKVKLQVDEEHRSQETSELPPSPPFFPLAPSLSSPSGHRSAAQS